MNTFLQVVQADYGYNLQFAIQNPDGTAFSLSGATEVYFRVQKLNKTSLKFSHAMVVVSASGGTCYYTVQSGDFDGVGVYSAQIQVVFINGPVTIPNIQITSIAKLPT